MTNLPTQAQIEQLELEGKNAKEVEHLKNVLKDGNKEKICNDAPSKAQKYEIKLGLGEVIITATDGVFDNLFNREILEIL